MNQTPDSNDHDPDAAAVDSAMADQASDVVSSDGVQDASLGRGVSGATWLISGVVSAILLTVLAMTASGLWNKPLPPGLGLYETEEVPEEQLAADNALILSYNSGNLLRFMVIAGGSVVLVFSLLTGVALGRAAMGAVGAFAGIVIIAILGMVFAPIILEWGSESGGLDADDVPTMGRHAFQWIVFAAGAFAAVAIASGHVGTGAKVFGSLALAGIIGAVLYVLGASILEPTVTMTGSIPGAGTSLFLWTCVAPLLAGVFMWRTTTA
ncbi:hypothetical protein K227x_17270 [Rubripirellula lacrimiformis]|uniref:Uncharacterized protein n=2 Tax=Rubripirellula lacrimiformis TaxID=1930273 RepID=A0A517N876_9BACT|nr:hypothetical protein K227x_17270 [Rubripirellula lacrimiformis]